MQRVMNASKQVLVKLVSVLTCHCVCKFVLSLIYCCYYLKCGNSPSGKGVFCEPVELLLLRLLLSLLTDKLDLNFFCILCETGVDGCFLGCCVVGKVASSLVPGPDPPTAPVLMLAPQEHVRVAPAMLMPGWIPLLLLSMGVPVLLWWKSFWSLAASPLVVSEGTAWGWAVENKKKEKCDFYSCLVKSRMCGLSEVT